MKLSILLQELQQAYNDYGEKEVVVDCSYAKAYAEEHEHPIEYDKLPIEETQIVFGDWKQGNTNSAKLYINCY